jgi:diguanylate cyclase (GGDEF)-like protein
MAETLAPTVRPDRILVVDDDRDVCESLAHILSDRGFEVATATDGVDALGKIDEVRPDLVLCDVEMPNMNGFELLSRIRQTGHALELPVILVSGSCETSLRVEGIDRGANDYVGKPVDSSELVARIKARLREAQLLAWHRAQAFVDDLTSVLNRRGTVAALEHELCRASRLSQPVSVLLVDVNDFKAINDTYGHLAGDQVLKDVARIMMATVRASDIVGRYGGDEFLVLLPDVREGLACEIAARLRASVQKLKVGVCSVSVSVGMATGWGDSGSAESLIAEADRTMYQEKQSSDRASVPLRS